MQQGEDRLWPYKGGVCCVDKMSDFGKQRVECLIGSEGLFTELKKHLINRVLESDLSMRIPALERG